MHELKGIGIIFALIITSGFISSQEVYGYLEPATKEDKQFMSGVFLVGFVVIYGGIIYLRKTSTIEYIKNNSLT